MREQWVTVLSRLKVRDIVMFGLGAWGFHHEVTVANADRPSLVIASLALMGLPIFLRRDER